MFGASTGARACWLVISDQIRANGVRAREILANLSAWLVATPSTLAQDWALAALQSPLAALRRPSPYMRERRDFMVQAADELAPARRRADRLRRDVLRAARLPRPRRRAVRPAPQRHPREGRREGLGRRLRAPPLGRRRRDPVRRLRGGREGAARYGTWQRLSYGSKDVKELAVFIDRVRARITKQGQLGSSAPAAAATPARRRRTRSGRASARRRATTRSTASTRRRSPRRGGASSRTRATRRSA